MLPSTAITITITITLLHCCTSLAVGGGCWFVCCKACEGVSKLRAIQHQCANRKTLHHLSYTHTPHSGKQEREARRQASINKVTHGVILASLWTSHHSTQQQHRTSGGGTPKPDFSRD